MNFAILDSVDSGRSLLVSGAFFEADARSLELAMMGLCALFAAWVAATFFAMSLDYMMENMGTPRLLKAKLDKRSPLITKLKNRRQYLIQQVDIATEHAKSLQQNRATLKQKLTKLKNSRDTLVRQAGENLAGTTCYIFVVSNRYVLNYAAKGQKHPLLDDSWKSGQLVEVWAGSMLEARVAIVERYPATQGFFVAESSRGGAGGANPADVDTKIG